MERVFRAAFISLSLLLLISNTRGGGRLLPSHQDEKLSTKHGNIQQSDSSVLSGLMGLDMEECSSEDEEACEKRRMVAEAHLDYIYTQHQHP